MWKREREREVAERESFWWFEVEVEVEVEGREESSFCILSQILFSLSFFFNSPLLQLRDRLFRHNVDRVPLQEVVERVGDVGAAREKRRDTRASGSRATGGRPYRPCRRQSPCRRRRRLESPGFLLLALPSRCSPRPLAHPRRCWRSRHRWWCPRHRSKTRRRQTPQWTRGRARGHWKLDERSESASAIASCCCCLRRARALAFSLAAAAAASQGAREDPSRTTHGETRERERESNHDRPLIFSASKVEVVLGLVLSSSSSSSFSSSTSSTFLHYLLVMPPHEPQRQRVDQLGGLVLRAVPDPRQNLELLDAAPSSRGHGAVARRFPVSPRCRERLARRRLRRELAAPLQLLPRVLLSPENETGVVFSRESSASGGARRTSR